MFATRANSVGQRVRARLHAAWRVEWPPSSPFLQKKVRTGRFAWQQAKAEAEKLKAKRANQMERFEKASKASQVRKAKTGKAMTGTATRRSAEPPRDRETPEATEANGISLVCLQA